MQKPKTNEKAKSKNENNKKKRKKEKQIYTLQKNLQLVLFPSIGSIILQNERCSLLIYGFMKKKKIEFSPHQNAIFNPIFFMLKKILLFLKKTLNEVLQLKKFYNSSICCFFF